VRETKAGQLALSVRPRQGSTETETFPLQAPEQLREWVGHTSTLTLLTPSMKFKGGYLRVTPSLYSLIPSLC
jgi:hypothetical protein